MTFGQQLKELREKKAIRLEEIASITKIHLHSLQMMENDRWDELPPEPFIRGFIIAYAKYVGSDINDVLKNYYEHVKGQKAQVAAPTATAAPAKPEAGHAETPKAVPPSEITLPAEMIENMDKVPGRKLLIGGFVGIIAVLVVGVIYIGKQSEVKRDSAAVTAGPETTTATESKPTPATPLVAEAPPQLTPEAKPVTAVEKEVAKKPEVLEKKYNLRIEGKDRCWMKIVVDEEKPKQSYLKPGQVLEYAADKKIKLVLGNGVDNEVFLNGKKVPGKKFQGNIFYYIYPAGSRFPQDPPPPKKEIATEDPAAKTEAQPEPSTDKPGKP